MGTEEPPGRCFPARCGVAWGGYGAAWAATVPRTGNTAFPVRRPSDISSGANQSSAHGFHESRDTNHESRPFYRVLRPSGGEKCRLGPPTMVFAKHETRDTNHGLHAFHESQLPYPRFPPFPTISRHFPAFPGPPTPPPPIKCPRVHAPSAFLGQPPGLPPPCRAARSLLSRALWGGMGRLWRGMGGRRPPHRQRGLSCSPAVRHFFWSEPVLRPWFSRITRHESRPFYRVLRPSGGEKCRLGPPTMVFTKHETRPLCFSRDTNHATWFFPVPSGDSKESNPKPDQQVFHETRNTRHESRLFIACFDRRVVRNAG